MDAPRLTFDEETHTYRHGGQVVPSVTQLLAPLVNFAGIPIAVLEAKRDLGQRVHLACQLHDDNDLDEDSIEEDVRPYLAAWRQFLAVSDAVVIQNERRVFEPTLRYAGTLDRVLQMPSGARWLVDLKTAIATPLAVGPQTAAYLRALADPSVTNRAALRLRPDGAFRFDALHGADDWTTFMACIALYRFKETHAS